MHLVLGVDPYGRCEKADTRATFAYYPSLSPCSSHIFQHFLGERWEISAIYPDHCSVSTDFCNPKFFFFWKKNKFRDWFPRCLYRIRSQISSEQLHPLIYYSPNFQISSSIMSKIVDSILSCIICSAHWGRGPCIRCKNKTKETKNFLEKHNIMQDP